MLHGFYMLILEKFKPFPVTIFQDNLFAREFVRQVKVFLHCKFHHKQTKPQSVVDVEYSKTNAETDGAKTKFSFLDC